MSRVARVSSEEIERLSNGFGKMGRECRMSRGSNHNGLLLGSEYVSENGWDDLQELREEDIWGDAETSSWDGHLHYPTFSDHQAVKKKNGASIALSKNRRSCLSMEMQAAGLKNEQGGIGFASLEPAQNGYGTHGGGKNDSNGVWAAGFSTRKVNIPQGYNNGWREHDAMAKGGVPQSAPMSVPVWEKCHAGEPVGDGDEEEEADARLPPHEIVARECARSQSTTFSVFEGTGRTLKGMDLRRVRNAVWSQTGFID